MKSYHIHIKGRVQGIGFRPFIYNLATKNGLFGTVSNTLDGVHVTVNCELCAVSNFVNQINELAPSQSLITSIHTEQLETEKFDEFRIVDSIEDGIPDLLITPDFATCDSCKEELNGKEDRRYQYPYITCTKCGPRFSIENGLPYDRQRTSMYTFKMCDKCESEFNDPDNERFYSQTNSCPDCRISQWLVDNKGKRIDVDEDSIISFACEKILEGAIIAVKGIGGFLLICDAQNQGKVMELREKKHRPVKPFALLYPDVDAVKRDFVVSEKELDELQGTAAPIVLLKPKRNKLTSSMLPLIAPGLNRLGVMVPYAPLLVLIAEKLQRPLLATSGNIKGSPIIYRNEEALESLPGFADYFLLNNREIKVPQDDSVVKFSNTHHQKMVIRRSRGYAPGYLDNAIDTSFDKSVLAMGALLKSTFSIWNHGRCHVSQFLGDTMEFDAQISYDRTLNHFYKLLQFKPEVVLVDKHPAYFSTHKGKELAAAFDAKIVEVQHHKAHFWAVLGENDLLKIDERVLGVIFDGTGMGNDGAVWGGEFFSFDAHTINRLYHLGYFPHILGDKMAQEPKLSALSILRATGMNFNLEKDKFTEEELEFYDKVLDSSSLNTSSMGRLFDAVSSLLGFCHVNTYGGEAAMYLECAAQQFIEKSGKYRGAYQFELSENGFIDIKQLVSGVIYDIVHELDKGEIAAKFHNTLVLMIKDIALRSEIKSIAFSGGVFQNGLLVDLIIDQLSEDFDLYFHKDLSPNDECISYGQLVAYYVKQEIATSKEKVSQSNNLI